MNMDEAQKEANRMIWDAVKGSLLMGFRVVGLVSAVMLGWLIAADGFGIIEVQVIQGQAMESICGAVTK